ncbi:L-lysine 2,3-aminomutase [Cladobotryum mycophilum]|uniref:L-lysine 2,3-aminomutase n=1 Tax=Cladobotryum mycophilum TaxID=491253 RepID=A0ABR0SBA5_9HYPO
MYLFVRRSASLPIKQRLSLRFSRTLATAQPHISLESIPDANGNLLGGAISSSLHVSFSQSIETEEPYWKQIPKWKDVSAEQFISHKWQMGNTVQSEKALYEFLKTVLPSTIPPQRDMDPHLRITDVHTPEQFISRVQDGIKRAPMAVRLSPHILSVINWQDPLNDPVRRQFIPFLSPLNIDHPMAQLDPLGEGTHSPVPGLVHRYPNKALFLATSICPVYCRFCVRSYAVGAETESVKKTRFLPLPKKWEPRFRYIENTPALKDIVVSGGDTIPHIRRFRFASKGLSVSPSRLIDPNDEWVQAIINLDRKARRMGKHVCIHTHFNNVNEITWITRRGVQRLYEAGVTVRNQTVLLNGVNNTPEAMCELVQTLADINIQPYYVYQGDTVPGAEDLRTPISDSILLERAVRGQIAGFMVPNFIVDLPGKGGKRLTLSMDNYDRRIGLSKFTTPRLEGETIEYWDPLWSLAEDAREEVLERYAGK